MNYTIEVFYTNSQTTRKYNASGLDQANAIYVRERSTRFVRKVELNVTLDTWVNYNTK